MLSRTLQLKLFFVAFGPAAALAQDYEAYYLNNRQNYPDAETNWSHNVQGAAHDDGNWFITNTEVIWKVPVELDLATISINTPGVISHTFLNYPPLFLAGYDHMGDPVVYGYRHTDDTLTHYLIVPVENGDAACGSGPQGAVAVFRCTDLAYRGYYVLPGQCNDAGWVAVDGQGRLYSSRQHIGPPPNGSGSLRQYSFQWANLHLQQPAAASFLGEIEILNEQGDLLDLKTMQGGEFAPGDKLLYLISGFHDDDDETKEAEGIHAIDTTSWQRVAHSTRGYGHFDYYYDPGTLTGEEPEGLTIWDLDGGQAPGIRGQLHAFVLDNDAAHDDIDFKHYTNIIRIVANAPCALAACCGPNPPLGCPTPFNETCEFGITSCPFRTLGSALNLAWDGSELRIGAGIYPESPTISKRVRLMAEGGVVRIGG
jgi:hypothetical protein